MQNYSKFLNFKNIKETAKNYSDVFPALKEERVKKFTTLVLTLVALSFFGLIAINPTLSTIAELNKELSDNTFVDHQLTQKINNLSILSEKYKTLQPDLDIILTSIPKNPEIPNLTAQIQSVSKSEGIDLISFQTFEVELLTGSKTYSSFGFALTSEGSYENIMKFLKKVTNMQRIIAIDTISLTKKTEGSLLQLNMKGQGFFSP